MLMMVGIFCQCLQCRVQVHNKLSPNYKIFPSTVFGAIPICWVKIRRHPLLFYNSMIIVYVAVSLSVSTVFLPGASSACGNLAPDLATRIKERGFLYGLMLTLQVDCKVMRV